MTKTEFDFDTWVDNLYCHVLDLVGVQLDDDDKEKYREDYNLGQNLADVAYEIALEYNPGLGDGEDGD